MHAKDKGDTPSDPLQLPWDYFYGNRWIT